jgi:hypothetical protein
MSDKVVIAIIDGEVSLIQKPDNIAIEVRDYIPMDDYEIYPQIHKDEQGDTYRVFSFPVGEVEKKSIGWQPDPDDFPVAGLHSFEVYEDLEHGRSCHPEVDKWIEIFEGMIEEPVIIPLEELMYRNFYRHCGEEWDDEWSCMCNDECPVCHKEIEPYKSEEIE